MQPKYSKHPHPDQKHQRERQLRKAESKLAKRPVKPTVKEPKKGPGIRELSLNVDKNPPGATLTITPNSGEYIDYVDIHEGTITDLGDWVGSMWLDSVNQGTGEETWKAHEFDFIKSPLTEANHCAVCYVSAFFIYEVDAARKGKDGVDEGEKEEDNEDIKGLEFGELL
jgi:hypothetical protein